MASATDTRHLVDQPVGAARADREAIMKMLRDKGFDHALTTVGHGIAVELVTGYGDDLDQRLAEMAARVQVTVIDALVAFARQNGWKGAR